MAISGCFCPILIVPVLVVPIIGFFSDVSFDSTIFSRDYLVMAVATILFVLVAASYSSNKVNIKLIKFVGCVFVAGYIGYILNLSNLI
jgi:Ca2+/Na+ antiporter